MNPLVPSLLLLTLCLPAVHAARIHGQVTDASTGAGLDHVELTFDLFPPDGDLEVALSTDPYGFYTVTNLPAGTYIVTYGRGGYRLRFETNTYAAAAEVRVVTPMAPIPPAEDVPRADIMVQVQCTTSYEKLARVPVRAILFEEANSPAPLGSIVRATDNQGTVRFTGLPFGFYRFEANQPPAGPVDPIARPKWDAYSTLTDPNWPDRTEITKPHLANILLKPQPQDVTVVVTGYDPVGEGLNQLSNVWVELTGHSLEDGRMLIPARTSRTGKNGTATFSRLPAIAWQARAKLPGYTSEVVEIKPDPDGDLPPGPQELPVTINPTTLEVVLQSPYRADLMTGLFVELRGQKGTGTEGIQRGVMSVDEGGEAVARFTNLPPGRYSVAAGGGRPSPLVLTGEFEMDRFGVQFSGTTYAQLPDGVTNRTMLAIRPVPARVRLRLFAADEMGEIETRVANGGEQAFPVYKLKHMENIRFEQADDSLFIIDPSNAFREVETDAQGEVVFDILPGNYGILLPDATNYWGSDLQINNPEGGAIIDAGWPYGERPWPWGMFREENHSAGLTLNSGETLHIDLYVRRKLVAVKGLVELGADDPTLFQIIANPGQADEIAVSYADPVHAGGMVTLTGDATAAVTTTVQQTGTRWLEYRFDDVGPDTYEFSATAPRYTISSEALTIGDWSEFPGQLPPTAPGSAGDVNPMSLIEGHMDAGVATGLGPLVAANDGSEQMTFRTHVWDPDANGGAGAYGPPLTDHLVHAVEPAFTSGVFSPVEPEYIMPVGSVEVWREFPGSGWYKGTHTAPHTVDVFLGGPTATALLADGPEIRYDVTYEIQNADDPTMIINTMRLVRADGTRFDATSGIKLTDQGGELRITGAEGAPWIFVDSQTRLVSAAAATPHFKVIVRMRLGLAVRGLVVRKDNLDTLANVSVLITDRYGRLMRTIRSGADGSWALPTGLPGSETLFVEVVHPGYQPWRMRFGDTNLLAAGETLEVESELNPVPRPSIGDITFNRKGLFIPGVKRSGNQAAYQAFAAEAALKTDYSLRATPAVYTNVMQDFDHADGSPGVVHTRVITDRIVDVWCFDPRAFGNGLTQPATETNVPPAAEAPIATNDAYLAQIRNHPTRFLRIVEHAGDGSTVTVNGSLQLSDLPAGIFRPVVAARTQRGQTAFKRAEFDNATDQLHGIELPSWMATSLDLIATSAGAQKTKEYFEDHLPNERFAMLPGFTGSIAADDDGYMTYDYMVEINWKEGMDTPGGGMLSLGPGVLGLSLDAKLNFGVDGKNAKSVLNIFGNVKTKELTNDDLLPSSSQKLLKKQGTKLSLAFNAVGESTEKDNFDPDKAPFEHEKVTTLGGGYLAKIDANLTPALKNIPYAGPVLLAADKSGALTISGQLEGGVGLKSESTWRTPFPPGRFGDGGSIAPHNLRHADHALRRHFLGGSEDQQTTFAICYRFGVGVSADSKLLNSGVSARLFLEGDHCRTKGKSQVQILPAPSCEFTFTEDFDWPLIKRVRGKVTIEAEAYADVWVTKLGRKWRWNALTIDHQFNTEAVFELRPMTLDGNLLTPMDFEAGDFIGTGPVLVSDVYPVGGYGVDRGAFVYGDASDGMMQLHFSPHDGPGQFGDPVEIAEAGGIIASAVAPLPGGGWMAVWSEIDPAAVGQAFPASRLMYATGNAAGDSWSAPMLLANQPTAVTREIQLVSDGTFLGLYTLTTDDGPQSPTSEIHGRTWNGASWSADSLLHGETPVLGFATAGIDGGGPADVVLAWVDDGENIRVMTGDGAMFAAPMTEALGAVGPMHLAVDANGEFRLAWTDGTGIRLLGFDGAGGWMDLGEVIDGGAPEALVVAPAPTFDQTLLAWTGGGDFSAIQTAYVDADGGLIEGSQEITGNTVGRYIDLAVTGEGSNLFVMARSVGEQQDIRLFAVGRGVDEPDMDVDGLADATELQIIDADGGDAIRTIAEVHAGDDFDGDGVSNGDEIGLGFDPTDPDDAPRIVDYGPDVDGVFELVFPTRDGLMYKVQGNDDLVQPDWRDELEIMGDDFPKFVPRAPTEMPKQLRLHLVRP